MNPAGMNLAGLLALVALWIALAGPTLGQLVLGLVVSVLTLALTGMLRARNPRVRPIAWARLIARLAYELVKSNLEVATHVLTPGMHFRPAILAIPLAPMTDPQIALLANMLTLTPGTAVLDISEDRSLMYVHMIDVPSRSEAIRTIKEGLERRVVEVGP